MVDTSLRLYSLSALAHSRFDKYLLNPQPLPPRYLFLR